MGRWLMHWFIVLFVLAGTLAWTRAVPMAEDVRPKTEDPPARPRTENPAVKMARNLNKKVDFPGLEDPKTTLADAIEVLTSLYGVSLEINDKAFKADGVVDILKTPIAETSPLPALKQASLERILRKILARIPTPSGANFVVRKDHIEITTDTARLAEFWPNGNENGKANPDPAMAADAAPAAPKPLPLVVIEFEAVQLDKALRELAAAADYNIVLDSRAADKGKVPVTASLINVPLDTAVRMLSDMVELKPVLLNNAIYVTTEKRADRFQPGGPFPPPGQNPAPGGMGALQRGAGQLGALGFGGVGLGGQFGAFGGQLGALGGQLGALGGQLGALGGQLGAVGLGGAVGVLGGGGQSSPFAKAASVHVENKPLTAALEELTDGRNVQLLFDKERIGQRGSKAITANLERVSVETGIRLLTDMAELSTVFIENIAYVTTRANARNFLEDWTSKQLPGASPSAPPEAEKK
jgi:hypothetical protein